MMKKTLESISAVLIISFVFALTVNLNAAIIAFEDFDGNRVGFNGTGWPGRTVQTGSEIAPGYGNYALTTGTNGDSHRQMTSAIDLTGDGVYYMSMLFRCTGITYQGMKLLETGGNVNQTSILFTNTINGTGGELEIFYQGSHQYPRTVYYADKTYLTVMKFVCSTTGDDSMHLAVYNLTDGDVVPIVEPTTWTLEETGLAFNRSTCDDIDLLGQTGTSSQFDNLLVATQWADLHNILDISETDGETRVYEKPQVSDTFTIELFAEPTSNVNFVLTPQINPTDIQLVGSAGPGQPLTVVFTPQGWETARTVTVDPIADALTEGSELAEIDIEIQTTDPTYSGLEIEPISVTIVDTPINLCPSGDFNEDCRVNMDDLVFVVSNWLAGAQSPANLDEVGIVNISDWAVFSAQWLESMGPVIINEFMASNTDTILDGNGESSDWIELYNLTNFPADLEGMYLTDTSDNLTKWRIPNGNTLDAYSYLLVFASNKDDILYPYTDSQGYLHTNFNLSTSGEYLALVAADGQTIIHEYRPQYPEQVAEISYGMLDVGPRYFITPTPLETNSAVYEGLVEDTKFSNDRGYYSTPVTVELNCDTPGATIHYTTDCTEPTELSTPYTGPITISTTTSLRAAAFKPGWHPSNTDTHTYLFVEEIPQQSTMWTGITQDPTWGPQMVDSLLAIPTMCIASEEFDPTVNTLYEKKASLEMIHPDGTKGFQIDAGLEHFGNDSLRRGAKKSMRFHFDSEYGSSKLKYDLFEEKDAAEEFDQIHLRCGSHDSMYWGDTSSGTRGSFIRARWSFDCQLEMEQLSPHGCFVHVYVNGQYWGQYHLQERPTAAFMASYEEGPDGDYDVLRAGGSGDYVGPNSAIQIVDGDRVAWDTMVASTNNYDLLQQYMDVVSYADYMLLEFYSGNNHDWNTNQNWVAARKREAGAGYQFIVWDNDFKIRQDPGADVINRGGPGNMWGNIKNHLEFKVLLADRAHRLFYNNGVLTPGKIQEGITKVSKQIETSIIAECARWGTYDRFCSYTVSCNYPNDTTDYDPDLWQANIDWIKNTFVPNRTSTVLSQLRSNGMFPPFDAPVFNINGAYQHGGYADVDDILTMTNPDSIGTIYYTLDGSDPRLTGGAVNPDADIFNTGGPTYDSTVLVEMNDAQWKYLYDGSDQGTMWRQIGFNDNSWGSGPGELGFGDGDEVTTIGSQVNGRMSAYFRHEFNATDVADIDELSIGLVYDDGAVIYINNQEVGRVNMPSGTIYYDTPAVDGINNNAVTTLTGIAPGVLVEGNNILAVEIHQINDTSSDISFDLQLTANELLGPGTGTTEILNKTTHVKARIQSGSTWSALNEAVYAVGPVAENLRVTEIMYHPADPNTEFIELQNVGTETINLNLVEFTRGVDFTFGDTTLSPNQYTVIVQNQSAFQARYPSVTSGDIVGQYTGRLDNDGDRIKFKDAVGTEIQDFSYEDNWYELTDGIGFSLTLVDPNSTDPNDWDSKFGWRSSLYEGGTPATPAQSALAADSIVINELLAHSHGTTPDWIELHNTTAQSINIGGWFLSDDDSDPNMIRKYEIPSGISIGANGYYVFYEDTSFGDPGLPAGKGFGLSEGGETLYLYSGQGGEVTGFYQTQQKFDASETDISFGRYEKMTLSGGYDFTRMASKTQTAPNTNSGPLIADIVITEIHYNDPNGTDYEFVELYNRSGSSVTLRSSVSSEVSPGNFITEDIGWRLEGTGFEFSSTTPVTIPSGEYILVAKDPTKYTGLPCAVYGPYDGKLDNGGEELEIQIPGDQEYGKGRYWIPIEKIDYDDVTPWPTSADGGGDSLQRQTISIYGRDYANWTPAAAPSPGH